MKKWHYITAGIIFVAIVAILTIVVMRKNAAAPIVIDETPVSSHGAIETDDLIHVTFPKPGEPISSPVTLTGEARGNWYFEASFPVVLVNWDGLIIAEGHADAQSDWMTTDFVPFKATLTFARPFINESNASYASRGAVIFKNDNPSGDPARDAALEVPVVFK